MQRPKPDALLSVAQAASLLGVHPNTVRAWTEAGRLTAYRINARGDRRFRHDDVTRILIQDDAGVERDPAEAELTVFGRIARAVAASPTPGSAARAVVEALRTELSAQRVAVYVADAERLELAGHAGFPRAPRMHRPLPAPDAAVHASVDVEMALATRRGPVGLLLLDRETHRRLRPAFADSLAASVATTLAEARLLGRARHEVERARALRSVTKDLTGSLDLEQLLDDIVERTRTLFGADRAAIWIVQGGESPEALVTRDLSDAFLADSAALTTDSDTIGARAIRDGRTYWVRDAHVDESAGQMRTTYAREGIRTVCIAPLISHGEAIGAIGLYHDASRTWPSDEVALVQAFADQAAVAIQNARLYRSVADQATRIKSIQDLSARLNRLTDVRAIADAIVEEASALAEYHDIRIYRVDWERRMCDPIAFTRKMLTDDLVDPESLLRVRMGEGFTGWVAEHGEPILINDAVDDERGKTIEGTEDVAESMLLAPMLYEGRAIGVIVLSQLGYNRFSDRDLQTMSIFAGYAAQAMVNATAYEQLRAQSDELARRADSQRRLLEISERLLSTLEPAAVLETIAEALKSVVAYDNLIITQLHADERLLRPILARDAHVAEVMRHVIPLGKGLTSWAVEHREALLLNDALSDPRALHVPGTPADPEAIIIVPLVVEGQAVGAMNIGRIGREEVHFTQTDFELVQLFAAQASVALRNAIEHHAVSIRAETDALTGLGNHGAFQQDLARLVESAAGPRSPGANRLAVLMMDLDRFKPYNDRHGHPAGDAYLHDAATAIYGAARSGDRVYRYGGDEFALILPGASVAEAARVGNRIRRAVARLTKGTSTAVTITVGVAGLPGDATDRASLITAADMALYYGKRAGEDRVVRADQVPRDLPDLRGTLEELASAALGSAAEPAAVEHLVERASELTAARADGSGTLRDALLAVSRSLEARGSARSGHADRVGRLAARIAERLGLPGEEARNVELAARLHELDDRGLVELAAVPSLRGVSAMIAAHRSLVDHDARGNGRARRSRGPIAAHVIGAAKSYDELVSATRRPRIGRAEAMEVLRVASATWRTDVLTALSELVAERPDRGRRRRRADSAQEARGAA